MVKQKVCVWKAVSLALCLLLLAVIFPQRVGANAAEPPSIILIVRNAPEDARFWFVNQDGEKVQARETTRAWESYYTLYNSDMAWKQSLDLVVETAGKELRFIVEDGEPTRYQQTYTLDLETMALTEGKLVGRSVLLVSLRVGLTLLLEGILFFLFGYRTKRSWLTFLIVNLVTQGGLNLWINTFSVFGSYAGFFLLPNELLILLVEAVALGTIIKEHSVRRTVSFTVVANVCSFILGGALITRLPI